MHAVNCFQVFVWHTSAHVQQWSNTNHLLFLQLPVHWVIAAHHKLKVVHNHVTNVLDIHRVRHRLQMQGHTFAWWFCFGTRYLEMSMFSLNWPYAYSVFQSMRTCLDRKIEIKQNLNHWSETKMYFLFIIVFSFLNTLTLSVNKVMFIYEALFFPKSVLPLTFRRKKV